MREKFKIKIVTPSGIEFDNAEVEFLKIRAKSGDLGILAKHSDYVSVLSTGKLKLEFNSNDIRTYFVSGGFLEVKNGFVTILAEDFIDYETKEEIFKERERIISESIKEKLKEDKDVLGTKKKIRDSLTR